MFCNFFFLHTAMAEPLLPSSKDGKIDVFINFRGRDTRTGFAGNLFIALSQRGVVTFMDDKGLRRGEQIKRSLRRAIRKSSTAIVVFSKNYAYSTSCLNELVIICECYAKEKMWIWPVFYEVDPMEVKYQTGSYGEAFTKHEQGRYKHDSERVRKWRWALGQVADLFGWQFKHGGEIYEHALITNIIAEVYRKLMDDAEPRIQSNVLGMVGIDGAFLDCQTVVNTQVIQAQSSSSSSDQFSQELHPGTGSTALSTHPTGLTQDDDAEEMDAFYASLSAKTLTALSEEARQAWKMVEDFFSDDASVLLQPERCCAMKTRLEYLSKLSADDGMSTKMSMLIVEASMAFPHWSEGYAEASMKIESTEAELQRVVQLETSLEGNQKQYLEVKAEEQMLLKRLESLGKRKRDIYERGKRLQALTDEWGVKVPCLLRENGFGKDTQTRIKAEWSELREKFKEISAEKENRSCSKG